MPRWIRCLRRRESESMRLFMETSNPDCRLTLPTPCRLPAPCGLPCELKLGPERHAVLKLGNLARLAIMAVPGGRGSFREQADELFAQVRCIVNRHGATLIPTTLMVFLRDGRDEEACLETIRAHFGEALPVSTLVVQPPCCGAALGIELWALGGPGVTIERFGPDVMAVESDGIRWIYCGGIQAVPPNPDPYADSVGAFNHLNRRLAAARVGFDQVVRTWIYINQITEPFHDLQRYQELNRARSDFYRGIPFGSKLPPPCPIGIIYPASTGIGTRGDRIHLAAIALETRRPDVFILPLENPRQTPAYDYQAHYSPQSPKFSRAMAIVQGRFAAFLVSGTASIVDSKTVHPGDPVKQTEQTIDNIEKLIAPENLARLGLPGTGATLRDVAKLRVYVKHLHDYEACRSVVERRLPRVPAIYLCADVCRTDLLVEIEAVAFAPCDPGRPGPADHATTSLSTPGTR